MNLSFFTAASYIAAFSLKEGVNVAENNNSSSDNASWDDSPETIFLEMEAISLLGFFYYNSHNFCFWYSKFWIYWLH